VIIFDCCSCVSAHRFTMEVIYAHRNEYRFALTTDHEPVMDLPYVDHCRILITSSCIWHIIRSALLCIAYGWRMERGFASHSTQNKSFRSCSSWPISQLSTKHTHTHPFKSALCSGQTTRQTLYASTPPLCFYRPGALSAAQPTASKHWRPGQYWKKN